jgi:hypothetical protein
LPVLKKGASFSVTGTLSPSARERVRDLAEYRIDDVLDVALIQVRIAGGHPLHKFRFDQGNVPNRNAPRVFLPGARVALNRLSIQPS